MYVYPNWIRNFYLFSVENVTFGIWWIKRRNKNSIIINCKEAAKEKATQKNFPKYTLEVFLITMTDWHKRLSHKVLSVPQLTAKCAITIDCNFSAILPFAAHRPTLFIDKISPLEIHVLTTIGDKI